MIITYYQRRAEPSNKINSFCCCDNYYCCCYGQSDAIGASHLEFFFATYNKVIILMFSGDNVTFRVFKASGRQMGH